MNKNTVPKLQNPLSRSYASTEEVSERSQKELARLHALPRRKQYKLRRKWRMSLAGIALTLALGSSLVSPPPAWAAGITVDHGTDVVTVNGLCSLTEAINNANDDTQFSSVSGECERGVGVDTITLSVDVEMVNTPSETTSLPAITSEIIIRHYPD